MPALLLWWLRDCRFVGALVTLVVGPGHDDLIALSAALKLKFSTGFCDTDGPSWALSTVLPFHVAVTF